MQAQENGKPEEAAEKIDEAEEEAASEDPEEDSNPEKVADRDAASEGPQGETATEYEKPEDANGEAASEDAKEVAKPEEVGGEATSEDTEEDATSEQTECSDTGGQIIDCKLCGKNFPSLKSLDWHRDQVHVSGNKYKCTKCEKSFLTGLKLNKHIISHTGSGEH